MANEVHKFCNRIIWESTSGETGDTLMRLIWEQYYDDKVVQVDEMQKVIPAVFATVQGITEARAAEDLREKRGGQQR